jgi:hypothetical protein
MNTKNIICGLPLTDTASVRIRFWQRLVSCAIGGIFGMLLFRHRSTGIVAFVIFAVLYMPAVGWAFDSWRLHHPRPVTFGLWLIALVASCGVLVPVMFLCMWLFQ